MLTTNVGLIRLLSESDPPPDAWQMFDALYREELYARAVRQGLQHADAEDVAQTIVGGIHRLLRGYERRSGQRFLNWLRGVAANECLARLRKAKGRAAGAAGLSDVADSSEVPAFEAAEEAEFQRRRVARAMELARPNFTARVWAAFEALIAGRAAAEVATELSTTVGAVRLARHRVLARLRELLEGTLD